jgi:hypothetical protein
MKKILYLLASFIMFFSLISCDDDTTDPTFTPNAKATIHGALDLNFESFSSTFSQEEINYIITSKYIATMQKNGVNYTLMFEYNDYFQKMTYDLASSSIKTSFKIGDNVVYDQVTQGEFNVETKENNKFDVNFGFIATSLMTGDTIYVTGGEISHDMD